MILNGKEQKVNRIPVRFVDEDTPARDAAADPPDALESELDGDTLSSEEIGRASSYEDETEVQRRIDRGQEEDSEAGREEADEADTAGAPPRDEMPEQREDQDESPSGAPTTSASGAESSASASQLHGKGEGPILAELLATRAELKRVEATVQRMESERLDLLDKLARRQAEFDNYRNRIERERGEAYHRVVGEVVGHLLPVFDNLRRALETEASVEANESPEFKHFLHGVELIYNQLNSVLEGWGIKPVPAVGQRFDPLMHEAVSLEQRDDCESDMVTRELQRGYQLGDKLLRPAIVIVSTK